MSDPMTSETVIKKWTRWTSERFEAIAQEIIDQFGCIPPRDVLNAKGYSGFVNVISNFGPTIGAEDRSG